MPDSPDYRLYLEEHFKRIDDHFEGQNKLMNAQFIAVNDEVQKVLDQALQTNDRVTHLEEENREYLKTSIGLDMVEACHTEIGEVKITVKKIDTDLEEYRLIKKYPKVFLTILAVFLIGFVLTAFNIYQNAKNNFELRKLEQVNTVKVDE